MPTITETPVTAFAHCRNSMCGGNAQEEVPATRMLVSETFLEVDGKGSVPGESRSWISFRFANDGHTDGKPDPSAANDVPCPSCGHSREISGTRRPTYQPLSGFSQTGLLNAPKFDPEKQGQVQADKIAELESKLEALMAKLTVGESQPASRPAPQRVVGPVKRGPGRPPKPKPGA